MSIQIYSYELGFRPIEDQKFRKKLNDLCSLFGLEWGDGTDAENALEVLKGVADEVDYCENLQSKDVHSLVSAIKEAIMILEERA